MSERELFNVCVGFLCTSREVEFSPVAGGIAGFLGREQKTSKLT
jgi:hypothetical protein